VLGHARTSAMMKTSIAAASSLLSWARPADSAASFSAVARASASVGGELSREAFG
jgi:hypothetical protein